MALDIGSWLYGIGVGSWLYGIGYWILALWNWILDRWIRNGHWSWFIALELESWIWNGIIESNWIKLDNLAMKTWINQTYKLELAILFSSDI